MDKDRMAKQKFNILLLVDTSRSMQGKRIERVNQAIHDISGYLKDMQTENTNVDFYISILTFFTIKVNETKQKKAMLSLFSMDNI